MAEADFRLMTEATGQRIAAALEALHLATVTGVKGNTEQNYRHGDVNITPADIGAVAKTGDTMTGPLETNSDIIQTGGYIKGAQNDDINHAIKLGHSGDNVMEFNEYGGLYNFYRNASDPRELIFQINGRTGDSAAPLTVTNGGTGATTAAVTITNDYSSVLNVINAVKGTRIFPISIQKNQRSLYSDMPSGNEDDEWNLLLVGDSTRLTANLCIFRGDQLPKMYFRHFYNGAWLNSWIQVV